MLKKFYLQLFLTACFGILFLFIIPQTTFAAVNHDLATTSNYNIRFDGAEANHYLSYNGYTYSMDLNGNDINDLVISSNGAGYNSRANSGSVYILFDTRLDDFLGTGHLLDLSDSSNFNIRIDGSASGNFLGGTLITDPGDLDGNGIGDIVVSEANADYDSKNNSGSLYVIYDSLLNSYTGTGNIIDLSNSSNFNIRFDGSVAENYLANLFGVVDFNNNQKLDLVITQSGADYNSRNDSGSIFVIYDSIIDDYTGTGNTVSLSSSSVWNLRFDGPIANLEIGSDSIVMEDLNNNQLTDLIIGVAYADNNSRNNSGSFYVIYDSIIDDYAGTGNTIDLATSTNWNVRYDGAVGNHNLSGSDGIAIADLDNQGFMELAVGAPGSAYNGSNTGSLYIINGDLIDNHTGTGNTVDLSTSSNWNVRYDGNGGDYFAYDNVIAEDMDFDGKDDITTSSEGSDYNSRGDSGSYFSIFSSKINSNVGTGNVLNVSTTSNYSLRFDSPVAGSYFGYWKAGAIGDVNSDGRNDFLLGGGYNINAKSWAGSIFVIYNFPHTVDVDTPSATNQTTKEITGIINAPNSTTTLLGVQYQLNSNNIDGTWTDCTADDGSFDELSEDYTCNLTGLTQGSHTVYVRSYDENETYTAQDSYGNKSLVVDTTTPTGSVSINHSNNSTKSRNVALALSASDSQSSVTHMMISNKSNFADAIWESYGTTKSWTLTDLNGIKTVYVRYRDAVGNESVSYSDSITLDQYTQEDVVVEMIDGKQTEDGKFSYFFPSGENVLVTGTTVPNSDVVVTVNSDPITCETTSDDTGYWECTFTETIPDGYHTMTVTVTTPEGDEIISEEYVLGIGDELADTGLSMYEPVIIGTLIISILIFVLNFGFWKGRFLYKYKPLFV